MRNDDTNNVPIFVKIQETHTHTHTHTHTILSLRETHCGHLGMFPARLSAMHYKRFSLLTKVELY
jgi:hypothetical protein